MRKYKKTHRQSWPIALRFYNTQMLPLLEYINATNKDHSNYLFKKTFEKYLIVSCVSLIEKYMILKIHNVVDSENIDISCFKSMRFLTKKNYEKRKIKDPKLTLGEFIIGQSDFSNSTILKDVTTAILKSDNRFYGLDMDFFQAVAKIDWYDPLKYVKGARAIFHNFNNFLLMFELRNKIIHEMEEPNISYYEVARFCDNTMNFLDATGFILNFDSRDDVIERLQSKVTMRQYNAGIRAI